MSEVIFTKRARAEMINYRREQEVTYPDQEGNEVTYPPNRAILSYDEHGKLKGIRFGNGDSATIPRGVNEYWRDETIGGTLLVMGQAPTGVTWLTCGTEVSIAGVDALKLHIIELTPAQVSNLEDTLNLFPNEEDIDADCHVLLAKYYNKTGINFGTEGEAMIELNTFLHGAWK